MTPMSRNVQFGWFTASNPGQNSTRRDSEKKRVKFGAEEKKKRNFGWSCGGWFWRAVGGQKRRRTRRNMIN